MQQTIEAVYTNGVLRLLTPLEGVEENRQVTVTVTAKDPPHPLADCIGILPTADAAEMRRIVAESFEQVDLNEWK